MELDILKPGSDNLLVSLTDVNPSAKIGDIKKLIYKQRKSLAPERQLLRLDAKGKPLDDSVVLSSLDLKKGRILYCKDLGPQIGWTTVFLCEYFGPIVCYLLFYSRPKLVYGSAATKEMDTTVHIAAACWTFHYAKRLYETVFVHRFSHSTMPMMNLFKNCTYYWGFASYVAYYVNHPLYTPPYFGKAQVYLCLLGFILSEIGNYSIHCALRDLRPPGTKERKIPMPTGNPFTLLFHYVSCPNYSYEFYSWSFFTLMTQCLPAGLFALAGFYQMAVWALGKHRNYKKEFPKYPKGRTAIIPFLV